MALDAQSVYIMEHDFYCEDYDGNDNYGIMYHKGEHIFICEEGEGEGGYYLLIASKKVTVNWGPASMLSLLQCIGKKVELDISNPADEAKILLLLDGNMSIYDGQIRWN